MDSTLSLNEYLNKIKAGEVVLVEHSSISKHPAVFYAIGRTYGWENLLVIDVIDSILPIVRSLTLSKIEIPQNIARIKIGGTSNWGKIITEIDPHTDPGIFLSKFAWHRNSYCAKREKTITVTLNFERLIPIQEMSRYFTLLLSNLEASYLGDPRGIVFHFINYEVSERGYTSMLEEIATRILRITGWEILIRKSPQLHEENQKLKMIL
ncbi:DUF257 family protein [Thermococcus barophilus]|uniref:DUF835 domain-containing protein n=1 Tax=Thermococcus barophilus TaxID=55802 RepID=A0A0S1XEL5_THEBA|nr:DUF257 family protein [Thermococcus barophilus]ALM76162.1 hypothetical protein TBCH5v1_2266 [Thermococcus barophilus]